MTAMTQIGEFIKVVSYPITYKRWEGLYHELHHEPEKAEVFQTVFIWIHTQISWIYNRSFNVLILYHTAGHR